MNEENKNSKGAREFFASKAGRIVMSLFFAFVVYTLMIVLTASNNGTIAIGLAILCGYFGWKALSMIQPSMFLWLSFVGWIMYFVIKGLIAVFIGVFVTPFMLGKKISDLVAEKL